MKKEPGPLTLKQALQRFNTPKAGHPGRTEALASPVSLFIKIQGLPPNYANARMHWRVKHISHKLWSEHVLKASISPWQGSWPLPNPKLTLTLKGLKEPDFDNLVSRWKPVIDGLVKSGIIQDDKLSVIGQPEFRWVKVHKLVDQGIEIVVESRHEAAQGSHT